MTTTYPSGIVKTTTDCCALCQLSRVNNHTPIEDIKDALSQLKRERDRNVEVGVTTGNGQTAVFTIVSPGEWMLRKNLIALGFKRKHIFERRRGYPAVGDLQMFIKNL